MAGDVNNKKARQWGGLVKVRKGRRTLLMAF